MKQVAQQPTKTILYTAQGTQVHIFTDDGTYQHYNTKAARILGILQIVLGILIIISQIVVIAVEGHNLPYGYLAGYVGLWPSIIFILAGIFGVISAKYKSQCTVILTMVLSFVAAVFTSGVMVENSGSGIGSPYDPHYEIFSSSWALDNQKSVAFTVIAAILSLTEAIVSIVATIYCCLGSFCQSKPQLLFTNQGLIPLHKAVPYQPLYDESNPSSLAYHSGTTPPPYVEKV